VDIRQAGNLATHLGCANLGNLQDSGSMFHAFY
jgi:hypothetical protein